MGSWPSGSRRAAYGSAVGAACCVSTAGPARRGDGSVREVTCPAGCVFPLGACCHCSVSAVSGRVRNSMVTARCRGRTHATGHLRPDLRRRSRSGGAPARRCSSSMSSVGRSPVAALKRRLAVSALVPQEHANGAERRSGLAAVAYTLAATAWRACPSSAPRQTDTDDAARPAHRRFDDAGGG